MRRRIRSFAPVSAPDATLLVLGTMPGKASLSAGEYYAHPRNAFWPIMERLFGIAAGESYPHRTRALAGSGVALWDVLGSCQRESSLDADIDLASARPNDIVGLLRRHPGIRTIYFNGQPARKLFERFVRPALPDTGATPACVTLPSTSPANARLSFEGKLQAWSVLTG